MPRMARAVIPGVPHHLTQRGIDRQNVFHSDTDRLTYLRLATQGLPEHGVTIQAYCLMSNHVHWVVTPANKHALARAFGWLHGRYAHYQNAAQARHGHFWQNRFFSCALDDEHSWAAIRYVERNPVRASLIPQAAYWPWSSAATRLGQAAPSTLPLDLAPWRERFTKDHWQIMLAADTLTEAERRLRASTYSGRPAGAESFISAAEAALDRPLVRQKGGRPRKDQPPTSPQLALFARP